MNFLGMLDKIDDIVYEPLKLICDWARQPIKSMDDKREQTLETQRKRDDMEIEAERNERVEELNMKMREYDIQLSQMIADQEDARRDRLVESMKNYQLTLAEAKMDIGNSLGHMSIDLRDKANRMINEYVREYKALQKEVKEESDAEIMHIRETFSEDSKTYELLLNNIIQERTAMIDTTNKLIKDLSEDVKSLTSQINSIVAESQNRIDDFLSPIKQTLYSSTDNEKILLEKKNSF